MIDRFVSITLKPRSVICCVLSLFALTQLILKALFCAAIRRLSLSFQMFFFLSPVQVVSCEISLVCHLKCPYNWSSHFLSLFIGSVDACAVSIVSDGFNKSFLVLVYEIFESLYRCLVAILNYGQSSSSFFINLYSLSTLSLGCKAWGKSFLVLWTIIWSSFLVHFKNGHEYLPRGTAPEFILLMRFLPSSLHSCSFLVFLTYRFYLFLSFSHV